MSETNNKQFVKMLLTLMLPIVLQNIISSVVNTADVLMLSGVTQNALSATSLAGQISSLTMICFHGFGVGVSILTAQYWGRGDVAVIKKTQGIALRYSLIVAFVFFAAAEIAPEWCMSLYTNIPELKVLGGVYLRVVALSWLLLAVTQVILSSLKSMEQTKLCMYITVGCLLCNVLFNALAIYVVFPGNETLTVAGVAGATVLSRVVELVLCLVVLKKGKGVPAAPKDILCREKWLVKDYWKCSLPMLLNLMSWGGGSTVMTGIMGRMSSDIVAANSLAVSLRSLVTVACSGMGAAGSILLGKSLGKGDFVEAKYIGKRMYLWSLLLGAAASLLLLCLRVPCLAISSLEESAQEMFGTMLLMNTLFVVGMSFNSCMVTGVFCAGGDTRFGLINDTFTMWGVILPLGYLGTFVFHWPPMLVYFVFCMDELVKVPAVSIRFFKYRWLKKLTREADERK